MKSNKSIFAFTGGGTGGHIYPGLAVADELKQLFANENKQIKIIWLGCSKGMDKKIVQQAVDDYGKTTVDRFYGIPSGKLRRYFSIQNFTDLFKITAGFFAAFFTLLKNKPCLLFSKGGFVSVPPCLAARLLRIPVFTHECDFTLGLANKINFHSAEKMFVSYEETKQSLPQIKQNKVIVTGNPVRPAFYKAEAKKGLEFLGLSKDNKRTGRQRDDMHGIQNSEKPVLLVLGGSSGAKQINELVYSQIEFLCSNFIVVHQTGLLNADDTRSEELKEKFKGSYLPYNFIYKEMPDVVACADVIMGRSGAGTIWEGAVLFKPMVLIPLCGSGSRGDQVDNALFFEKKGAAAVLVGEKADGAHLREELTKMLDIKVRNQYSQKLRVLAGGDKPAFIIARLLFQKNKEITGEKRK